MYLYKKVQKIKKHLLLVKNLFRRAKQHFLQLQGDRVQDLVMTARKAVIKSVH